MIRNNTSQQLKFVMGIQASSSGPPVEKRSTVFSVASQIGCTLFDPVRRSSVIDSGRSSDLGQFVFGSESHEGPLHHNWLLFNLEATSPRDPISAGLSSPGQWFHIYSRQTAPTPLGIDCFAIDRGATLVLDESKTG